MEWESDSPCRSHTYSGQGHRYPGRCSSWELEFRDCGAIPGWGLLLTMERRIEGMWGKCLWRKSQAAMEARRYCWVTWGSRAITIASLSPYASRAAAEQWRGWTIKQLAHWSTENDPGPWTGGAAERDCPKRPSAHQLQEAWKKTLIGP